MNDEIAEVIKRLETDPHGYSDRIFCRACENEQTQRLTDNARSLRVEEETINHPSHYGGGDNPYEAIKVIEAWELGFALGNAVKYISRAGKKTANPLEDLRKARWYLDREITRLESQS